MSDFFVTTILLLTANDRDATKMHREGARYSVRILDRFVQAKW